MTDVRTLLGRAAGPAGEVPDEVVTADLARGRGRLRRRTAARAVTAAAAVLVVAGGLAVATDDARVEPLASPTPTAPGTLPTPTAPSTRSTPSAAPRFVPVRLVAYTGEQPSGYVVAYVPKGWEIQGANAFRMTIAPVGAKDRHPDSFTGKLVVMLQSADATGEPAGRPIPVGDRTGYLNEAEETADTLTFEDGAGHWVQVQVPPRLRWSDAEIGRFAAGVEITGDAATGVG